MFWDATPEKFHGFVADPSKGSRHNRGCAVDLGLYDLKTGKVVEMVSGYDEFSDRAFPDYPGGTSRQRWHRDLLRHAMEAEGFTVYEEEWWHFDYKDWRKYPILNKPFEEIKENQRCGPGIMPLAIAGRPAAWPDGRRVNRRALSLQGTERPAMVFSPRPDPGRDCGRCLGHRQSRRAWIDCRGQGCDPAQVLAGHRSIHRGLFAETRRPHRGIRVHHVPSHPSSRRIVAYPAVRVGARSSG